jgi:hypothetical protein
MLALALIFAAQEATPRTITSGPGDLVEVRVPVAAADDQRAVVVEFVHEEALDRIVPAMDPEDVSLVQNRNRLFVKALAERGGTIDVIGASGTLYRLRITPAREDADSVVRILRADVAAAASPPGPVEFARALRMGIRLPGMVVRDGGNALLATTDGVEFRLRRVVTWRAFRGYVLDLRNTSGQAKHVDERRMRAEGLVAVGATRRVLAAGETARVILVFHR